MFKLKEFDDPDEKLRKMSEIKTKLEALPPRIPELKAIRVDFNVNLKETWDLALTADVNNLEDLEKYANHPDHVFIIQNIIAPVKTDRACVDYEA